MVANIGNHCDKSSPLKNNRIVAHGIKKRKETIGSASGFRRKY